MKKNNTSSLVRALTRALKDLKLKGITHKEVNMTLGLKDGVIYLWKKGAYKFTEEHRDLLISKYPNVKKYFEEEEIEVKTINSTDKVIQIIELYKRLMTDFIELEKNYKNLLILLEDKNREIESLSPKD